MINSLTVSRNLAFGYGIALVVAETIRRRNQLADPDYFIYWFDDYLLGAFLVLAAWKVLKNKEEGKTYLAAAWGVAVGALFLSTLAQLEYMQQQKTDPAPVSTEAVFIIKTFFLLLAVIGMILCFGKTKKE